MNKLPKGFNVNVDNEIKMLSTQYPNFKSVNAGYWLYGKPKKLLKDVLESRKTSLFYIHNIMNSISTLGTLHKLNEDFVKEGVARKGASFIKNNYEAALNQLTIDLKEYRKDYAKSFVFEQLLKLKIMEAK
ncbi:hypothetical protein Kolga_gp41 [Pelagibacter phage Kolga EXVC016S]|nr:hypothetical protein Kolga_gp41 [Pelagibacter phage Kolga EXVC016S]